MHAKHMKKYLMLLNFIEIKTIKKFLTIEYDREKY